jgi:DNA polymerase
MAAADRRSIVLVPTVHPSAVLRANDRDEAYAGLVADLEVAARALAGDLAGRPGSGQS